MPDTPETFKLPPLTFKPQNNPVDLKWLEKVTSKEQPGFTTLSFGDYTIVAQAGSDIPTKIIDANSAEMSDFDRNGRTKYEFNLSEDFSTAHLPAILRASWVVSRKISPPSSTYLSCTELSTKFKINPVSAVIEKESADTETRNEVTTRFLQNSTLKTELSAHRNISVCNNGKYVFVTDDTGNGIAFVTQNDTGNPLLPNNWKRFDLSTPSESIPKELGEYFYRATEEPSGRVVDCGDKYVARASTSGITVFDKSNLMGEPLFTDKQSGVARNICTDPKDPNVIYYCKAGGADIFKLDVRDDPTKWQAIPAHISQKNTYIINLQLDPSGNFFMLSTDEGISILAKDTLKEIGKQSDITSANFDSRGKIRGIDKKGQFVVIETNLQELGQSIDIQRASVLAKAIEYPDVFATSAAASINPSLEQKYAYLKPVKTDMEAKFAANVLTHVRNLDDIPKAEEALQAVMKQIQATGSQSPETVDYLLSGIKAQIVAKNTELIQASAVELLTRATQKILTPLSLTTAGEIRADIAELDKLASSLDESTRLEITALKERYTEQSTALYRQQTEVVQAQIGQIITDAERRLQELTHPDQFESWREADYPQIRQLIAGITRDCPSDLTAVHDAALGAQRRLMELANTQEQKFQQEYRQIREKVATRIDSSALLARDEIDGFIQRLQARGFKNRTQAVAYINGSQSRQMIEEEISVLSKLDASAADTLRRRLKVLTAQALGEIERGGKVQIGAEGQQLVAFGSTLFPRWEHKAKEKPKRQVTMTFEPLPNQTAVPGDTLGDIVLVINEKGESRKIRLFEGWADEQDYRLGLKTVNKQPLQPSLVKASEYNKIRTGYMDWSKGANSDVRKEMDAHVAKLKAQFDLEPKFSDSEQHKSWLESDPGQNWRKEYDSMLSDYLKFVSEKPIYIFRHIDDIRNAPEARNGNGVGEIPKWQNHWTRDADTEMFLEQLAVEARGQLERQEGMINLEGHAGTGKDVALAMFASETNRPMFTTDCSKWTSEPELVSDITLQVKEGASYVVDVPSSVLLGIQTPGAIVYFNEFNAMPLPSQILLHSLMSEKRSLTLKFKSGKVIKVDPSVIIAGSQNPNYPGTFDPQMATSDRMVTLRREYPPQMRDDGKGKIHNYVEALRMAREVRSLADLTDDPNMEANEFVKLWDSYINGRKTGAPKPTSEQAYDMDVLLGLTHYATKLRQEFVNIIEPGSAQLSGLPVALPVTGRTLRRCANYLSKNMTPDQKPKTPADETVRMLLEKYFVNNLHKQEDRQQIMKAWTSAPWSFSHIAPSPN